MTAPDSRDWPRPLLAAAVLLGAVLTATVVPGVFTVDEDHYLVTVTALRAGGLTVPGTDGLTPSRELRWFDPEAPTHAVDSTPVSATVPPLYAFFAYPFSWLGWRGLVLLNTLAFMAAVLLVARCAARHHPSPLTPWIAAATFALGGYAIEYAQAVWPHMLAAALAIAAFDLSARVRDDRHLGYAFAAGIAAALATGLRYQNFFFAACLGLTVLLWARRRWSASALYAAGCALPLAACSLLNRLRLGFWNPISKGPGYLRLQPASEEPQPWLATLGEKVADALRMGWARIGDFSTRPPIGGEHAVYLQQDPATGAYVVWPAVKKAWLQSAPWLAVALAVLLLAWVSWRAARPESVAAADPDTPDPHAAARRRELRALSLVVFPLLALFAVSGVGRTDGLCYNQRYFIELMPLAAVAFAWAWPRGGPPRLGWLAGGFGLAAWAGFVATLPQPTAAARQLALLYAPLVLALALLVAWLLADRGSERRHAAFCLIAGLCLGWSLAVHLFDDVAASRLLRGNHREMARQLDDLLPQRAALFTWWGGKDAAGPLLLDHDLVVLDLRNDGGETAPRLLAELQAAGRRTFVLPGGVPRSIAAALSAGQQATVRSGETLALIELAPAGSPAPPP